MMGFFPNLILGALLIGYITADMLRKRYMKQVKQAVPASLERMAAIRSAIIATVATIVPVMGVVIFFSILFVSEDASERFMNGACIALYLFISIVLIRELVKLIKDDDSWFNRSWKKLKKWAKSRRFSMNLGLRPSAA